MNALIIHGGAGRFRPDQMKAAQKGCKLALEAGRKMLKKGGSALDVVEHVVRLLEDDPVFDAGRGSFPNAQGDIEMDAIFADGATQNFGAVAAIRHVDHPVSVARAVLERTKHCMLVGEGATAFAHEHGFAHVPHQQLIGQAASGPDHGTVGALALDENGHLAAAVSTGGTADKLPGRVGDSAIIGCGAIAEDGVGAVAATGSGEHLMRIQMARTVRDKMLKGAPPQQAAAEGIRLLHEAVGGLGGVIALAPDGRIGFAYNTTHLAVAYADAHKNSDIRL